MVGARTPATGEGEAGPTDTAVGVLVQRFGHLDGVGGDNMGGSEMGYRMIIEVDKIFR